MKDCAHRDVRCLNHFDFIRKYRCNECLAVLMCACDEDVGRRFLPHQLREATEYETQRRFKVTLGFQPAVCNKCRDIPEEAHPMAPQYGRTSKIVRYYWREIWFQTARRFGQWCELNGQKYESLIKGENDDKREAIEREVIEEIKRQHEISPKYQFNEQSQSAVLSRCGVEIVKLDGVYVRKTQGKAAILWDGETYSAENFAAKHFEQLGYTVLETESRPFHVLFGVFMWILIQDPEDPRLQTVHFGEREAFDKKTQGKLIATHLPQDFGTPAYAERRAIPIEQHFSKTLPDNMEELLWTFDYWVPHSYEFRQYLWAHDQHDISIARNLVTILPADVIRQILQYLVGAYFKRYCGWPDLLAHRNREFLFLEVKSSKDELSEDQKRWIEGNHTYLRLPFKLVKIHKKAVSEAKS